MAKREVFVDDLTGDTFDEGGGRTILLALDDESTAVDLTNENIDALKKMLSPYFQKGGQPESNGNGRRNTRRTSTQMPTPRTADNRDALKEIRKWAKKNGWPRISERGRIPYAVMDAYTKAHLLTPGRT